MGSTAGDTSTDAEVELDPLTIAETRGPQDDPTESDSVFQLRPAAQPGGSGSLSTLASQLAGLPGAIVQDSFGGFDPPRITLRGSGLQSAPVARGVWWSLDDIPLNAADGSFNSALIDPALAAEIQLVHAALDPIAAGSALGGAIALHAPHQPRTPQAWLSAGEHGYVRAGMSTPVARDGWLGASYAAMDGWRDHSGQSRFVVHGTMERQMGRHGPHLTLGVFAANPRYDVPGPLTRSVAESDPGSISILATVDRPRRETEFAHIALASTWRHDVRDATRLALAYQHTGDWFRQLRANGISDTHGADLTLLLETRRRLAEVHALNAGVLARAGDREQQRWFNASGTTGERFADADLDAGQAVAWVDDAWRIAARAELQAGVSISDITREVRGAPASAQGSSHEQTVSPRIGLTWATADALKLMARVTRGSEPATFDDLLAVRGGSTGLQLYWTPLRPQRSDTLEIGFSGKLLGRAEQVVGRADGASNPPLFTYSCVAYQSAWDDEFLRLADSSGAALGTVNADDTLHRGVEMAVRCRLIAQASHAVDLSLTYTWSEARFEANGPYQGKQLAGLPPHAGSAQLTWSGDHGVFGLIRASWIDGTTYADHANRLGYSGYTVMGARAGWADPHGWCVFVEVDNLLDCTYIASTSGVTDVARIPDATALFLPGSPRLVRVGFSWRH